MKCVFVDLHIVQSKSNFNRQYNNFFIRYSFLWAHNYLEMKSTNQLLINNTIATYRFFIIMFLKYVQPAVNCLNSTMELMFTANFEQISHIVLMVPLNKYRQGGIIK